MELMTETLKAGAAELGIELEASALEQFEQFTAELLEWNAVMNLTAITEPQEIAVKHYIDSLAVLKYAQIPLNAKFADVGGGAGFPGIPLRIVRPDILLTEMDSLNKRVNFQKHLIEKLKLKGCDSVHLRAEEAGQKSEYREVFDVAAARAVAQLRIISEYCLPLVRIGGIFIAMKGGDAKEEIAQAKNAVKILGGEIENCYEYCLPKTDFARSIIIIRKVAATPQKYPRPSAKIAKNIL